MDRDTRRRRWLLAGFVGGDSRRLERGKAVRTLR